MVFISKLEEHSVQIVKGDYLRYYIQLSPDQLNGFLDDPKLKSVFISRPVGFRHCFDLSPVAPQVEELIAEIAGEFDHPSSFSRHYIAALFSQMMILCYRVRKEQFPLPPKTFGTAIFEAQKYIDSHFTQRLPIDDLARRFYISPSYLSHAFHEWTGYSPKQYIMLSRISYAKELLINEKLAVMDIAARCGFCDVNDFIRAFRKQTGVTPNLYRKKSS